MITITSQSAILHLCLHKPRRLKRITFYVPLDKMSLRLREVYDLAQSLGIAMDMQTRAKSVTGESQENISAMLAPFDYTDAKAFLQSQVKETHSVLLALDHLQDTQNFGALCRTAEGLGVAGVILPKDRSVSVSPGAYHASVGAVETIPIMLVTNLAEYLRKCKDSGFWIVGTEISERTQELNSIPKLEKSVLVLGSELEGMSTSVANNCDFLVRIPLKGKIESLNVSVAGALLMNELLKMHRS